jgi:glycosyltransferase involved in cell wall biosynthesis
MVNEISVILNVYKRPYNLEKQIDAILNQTVNIKPENIHVWYNNSNVEQILPNNKDIKTYKCSWNSKFHGRFTIPLLCRTNYVAMFDDDILPEKEWLKNCLNTMNTNEGILGGSGIILSGNKYNPHTKVGWNGIHSNNIMKVDLVGHAWFFKQEWSKYLWYEKPFSWENGEDIMFSYLAQKYGNINTFVPPHPEENKNLWSSNYNFGMKNGDDSVASCKISSHYGERDKICIECINNGWKTIKNDK